MRFIELQIKGFGKFHDRTITFEDGLNVVYGKNEAGKSTIHTFIQGMLFGIQPQRGKASRNDLYNKYEPWENSGTYEGALRLEHGGHIYRIERTFQKTRKELRLIDETLGKSLSPDKALMDQLLCGLSETAYNNTISIGQLKCATDAGMVTELKNYIANMNTTGNMALNITKATDHLKSQKKQLEAQLVPEAARSYTSLLGEIKTLEREISSPADDGRLPLKKKKKAGRERISPAKSRQGTAGFKSKPVYRYPIHQRVSGQNPGCLQRLSGNKGLLGEKIPPGLPHWDVCPCNPVPCLRHLLLLP